MSDEDELFEQAMQMLGTRSRERSGERAQKPAARGVSVTEDLDFEALMRGAPDSGQPPPAADGQAAGAPTAGEAPVADRADAGLAAVRRSLTTRGERSRYVATPEEARVFLEAVHGLGTPPSEEREEALGGRPAPRAREPKDDLGRRLKRAEVEIDAVLDLHGRTQREARPRLAGFIAQALRERWEIVAIVVGRGMHSEGGEPVLRPVVERWLREDHRAEVREIHVAPPYLGGTGAWIAALRIDATRP